jgi:MoxR-like ATPase
MHEKEFSTWLAQVYRTDAGSAMDPAARGSRFSNCRRVEQYLGDLDHAYDTDRMASLLGKLELSRNEMTPRHNIPIDGDLYNGTATLKSAARLYQKFRASMIPTSSNVAVPARRSPDLDGLDAQLRVAIPDDTQRRQAAALMGRLIDAAARTMPAGWALSWRQKRGIFLTLTFYRVFAVDRNRIFIAFTTSEASPALKKAVERARVIYGNVRGGGYLSMDDTTSAYVPTSFYFERSEELEPLIERFAARIAQKYTTTAFARYHSPAAVEWLEQQLGRDLASPAYEISADERAGELGQLVDQFEAWCATETGSAHLQAYAASRASAAQNLEEIRTARGAGEDITDRVLRGVLPHLDTAANRARGAWISIASAVAGDIRTKLRRTDDQWQRVASRILEFIEAALAQPPANLAAACASFAQSPESHSFQSGMLTPFLNAMAPEHFAILNKKSRLATQFIAGTRLGQTLIEYPHANEVIRVAAAQLADVIDATELNDVPDGDLYDAFSHWLVSERRFFEEEEEEEEPLFSDHAFALFSLLDAEPSGKVYQERKNDFRTHIEEPFRRLFAAVAERLTPEMQSVLETRKNLFAKFLKNDYGRGGAWPYYWGAFYPVGTQRVRGTQFFVYASSRYVTFGFFAGEPEGEAGQRAAEYLSNAAALTADGFDGILGGYVFGDGRRIDDGTLFPTLQACLTSGDDSDLLDIRKILRPGEVTTLSLDDLADIIAASFCELFPLMRIAIGPDGMPVDPSAVVEGDAHVPIDAASADARFLTPPYSLHALAQETGIRPEIAAAWVRAIHRKGQAIFYGPPGTGKTYVAEKLARHLAGGSDGFAETLQFHPAYSYEDFMEGMRPQSDAAGRLTYPVIPGRFRSFCERASRRAGTCVLIIDEINRANLGRVLGELMYLLEYREASVPLASGTPFRIPANVRIIGTMNTADRSIALVDHALRRRFAFIALHPDYGVLTRHHEASPLSLALAALLKDINNLIDPHYRIGISFFMEKPLAHHLPDIWRMEIEPYLEEYFFDDLEKCKPLRWESVAQQLPLGSLEAVLDVGPESSAAPLQERKD